MLLLLLVLLLVVGVMDLRAGRKDRGLQWACDEMAFQQRDAKGCGIVWVEWVLQLWFTVEIECES